jgi:hypothetical protein
MLKNITKKFFCENQKVDINPIFTGHINDTYIITIPGGKEKYILQKINTNVFTNPQAISDMHRKLQELFAKQFGPVSIANILPDLQGNYLTWDSDGQAWRLTGFIEDSYTIEVVQENWQAREAGNAYGWFAFLCSSLNPCDFKEPIKNFHSLSCRLRQFKTAVANDHVGRLNSVQEIVGFYFRLEKKLAQIETLVKQGKIPLRVVHNDTKISNLLFRGQKAVAVIDLDTTGPGILYYDYGDAIRTIANNTKEDEKDLTLIEFNIETFEAFTKAYLHHINAIVTDTEKDFFYLAPMLLTYLMGIRFLTDYLNGDVYYKVNYTEHNLDRSKAQKALIESMERKEETMKKIIKDCFSIINAEEQLS